MDFLLTAHFTLGCTDAAPWVGGEKEEESKRNGMAMLQVSCVLLCVCSCKRGVALDFLVKGKHACHVGFNLLRDSLVKKEALVPRVIRERKVF